MMRTFIILCFIAFFVACESPQKTLTASEIVGKSIAMQCVTDCGNVTIDFTFRDKSYQSTRQGGNFTLKSSFKDSLGAVTDILTNTSFTRLRNRQKVVVTDSLVTVLSDAVNSVHYFAQLPYGLQAPATNKKLVGEETVKDKPYYKIEVTFNEKGGGTDYEDVFLYWIHKQNFTVDYLAYSYATNGGGIRFREAYNPRVVNGIRFVDYNNYKPSSLDISLYDLDNLFENNDLQLLSKIETENINVTPL